jgi:hypothetical protein
MQSVANLVRSKGDPKIVNSGTSSVYPEDRLAKSLGWFSIGLGLAQIFAPYRLTRVLGMSGMEPVLRAFGAREIMSGVITLSTEKDVGLWARLAGDALDIAVLTRALSPYNPQRNAVKLAMLAVAGVAVLDAVAASSVSARKKRSGAARTYTDRSGFPKGIAEARGTRTGPRRSVAARA